MNQNSDSTNRNAFAARMRRLLVLLLVLTLGTALVVWMTTQRARAGVSPEQATAMATLQFRLTQLVMETQPAYAVMEITGQVQPTSRAVAVNITPIEATETSQPAATATPVPAEATAETLAGTTEIGQPAVEQADAAAPMIVVTPVSKAAEQPAAQQNCYRATILAEATYPDAGNVPAGSNFMKTWRIRNDGTCTWESGTQLVFLSGERMSLMEAYTLATQALPGGVMEISAGFTAPTKSGTFSGNWQLLSIDGQVFGTGEQGQSAFEITIHVP